MGQGSDSCGGWEIDSDFVDEILENGIWIQRDGTHVPVDKMTSTHIKNSIPYAKRMAKNANFSYTTQQWDEVIDMLENELNSRSITRHITKEYSGDKAKSRGEKVKMRCHCGNSYSARSADLKRGWGFSCSKRCAAIRRKYGRPRGRKITDSEI